MRLPLLALLCLFAGCSGPQRATAEQTAPVEVVEEHGHPQAVAFSRLMRWVAQTYNSAQNVVQLSDAEGGTIVVRGVAPVGGSILGQVHFHYAMTMDVRDNRVRFQQTMGEGVPMPVGRNQVMPELTPAYAERMHAHFADLRASALAALAVDDDF